MAFYVYILRCADGTLYVGHTDDLEARIVAHRTGAIPGYTRGRRPVRLVFAEEFSTRDNAFQRERQIKGWTRAKKQALMRRDWPGISRLARARGSTGSPRAGAGERQ